MNFLRPKSIWNSMNEIVEEISFQVQFCEWRHAGRRSINARTQWTFFPDSLALTFNQRKPLCWIKASKVWSTRHPRPIVLLHRPYNFLYVLYKMTCQWLCMMLILILYSAKAKIGAALCCVLCRRRWEDNRQRNWTSPGPKPAWPGWDRDKTSWSIKLLSRSCSVNWPP